MTDRRPLVYAFIVLGLVLLYITYSYLSHTADALPSWLPGHAAGSSVKHTKHGIAALMLAVGSFVIAWFQSAPKKSADQQG
jgi:hypothetical protein